MVQAAIAGTVSVLTLPPWIGADDPNAWHYRRGPLLSPNCARGIPSGTGYAWTLLMRHGIPVAEGTAETRQEAKDACDAAAIENGLTLENT